MCGLAGFSFKQGVLSSSRRAVLATNLAQFNDMRGGDSWGVVGVKPDDIHIARGLGELGNHAYEMCDYLTMFAHTRWATHGDATIENAHPFEIGNVIGAHNGVLYNHEELCKQYSRDFAVDSMHLFAHIDEKRSFDDLIGYGAVEWMYKDDRLRRIYLSRLREGELAIVGIGKNPKSIEGIVWSSSYKHLALALLRAGVKKFIRYKVPTGKVFFVHRGKLLVEPNVKLELAKMPEAVVVKQSNHTSDYEAWGESYGMVNFNNFKN